MLTVLLLVDDAMAIGTIDDMLIQVTSGWFMRGIAIVGD